MANYEIVHKIDDAQGHFTGMVVSREVGLLDKRVRYSLVVKNNASGRESKRYHLMDINKETSDSEVMTGNVCSMLGVPTFTESGLENSIDAWTYDQSYPAKVNRKELRKIVIPRDKFPE